MTKKQWAGVAAVGIAAGAAYLYFRRSIPKGAEAVKPFDINRYLGQWYEIARFDYQFEKKLIKTSAHYSLNEDGSVKVINWGYSTTKQRWVSVTGKAVFVDDPQEAKLKVSFFGPIYAGYNVIAIDPDYQYALVAGRSLDYLWLLSREQTMPPDIKEHFLRKARELGYKTEGLNWVKQG